jgi:hypothetical protein
VGYYFGGIKEFSLEQIESEVLNESVYLDVFAGSDLRLKSEVRELPKTLSSLGKLDAILYTWNQDTASQFKGNQFKGNQFKGNQFKGNQFKGSQAQSRQQVGLIAQQVAEVFPELVAKDQETGFLAVNYQKLTTHLLVAIQELNAKIEAQERRIDLLEKM